MKLVDDKSDLAWIRGFSSKFAWPVARPEGEKHRRPWMSDAAQVGEQPEINSRRKTECVDCLSTPYLVAITISPELHVRLVKTGVYWIGPSAGVRVRVFGAS